MFPYNDRALFDRRKTCGGIAQLARAFGSYPKCHRFKSSYRYQRYKVSLKYPGSAAIVTDKLLAVLAKSCILIRPVGQAVKTRPFHGCNMGSIPVRVTKTSCSQGSRMFFFISMRFGPTYGNRKARPAVLRPGRFPQSSGLWERAREILRTGHSLLPQFRLGDSFFTRTSAQSPGRPVGRPYIHPGNQHPRTTPRRGQGTRPTGNREFVSACRVGS